MHTSLTTRAAIRGIALMLAGLSALALGGCRGGVSDADLARRKVTAAELRILTTRGEREKNVVLLIDSRSPAQFAENHIAGARNIELGKVNEEGRRSAELERCANLVVYGNDQGDPTAPALAKRLMAAKYRGVRLYAAGLREWVKLGYPTEKSPPPAAPSAGR